MALDTRIPLMVQQPDPIGSYGKAMSLKSMASQQRMADMQLQQAEREQSEQRQLADLYRTNVGADGTINRQGLLQGAATSGLGARIPALQKSFLEADKGRAELTKLGGEAQKLDLGNAKLKLEATGAALSSLLSKPDVNHNDVIGVVNNMVNQGFATPEEGAQIVRQLPGNPAHLRQYLMQKGMEVMEAGRRIEMMTPKVEAVNLGGTTQMIDKNALTNPSVTGQSFARTQTPESIASNATAIRGQNLTDARGREFNDIQRQLVLQEKGLKVAKMEDEARERQQSRDAGIASVATQIGVIDKALNHPGRATSTGMSGTIDPRNFIPGTDATDFRAVLDQIGGTAFLQAFESLKGGGQITEVEGKKATDAMARLSRAQSDEEFTQSLQDLREVMTAAYERKAGKPFDGALVSPKASAPKPGAAVPIKTDADYNKLPSGTRFQAPDGTIRVKP